MNNLYSAGSDMDYAPETDYEPIPKPDKIIDFMAALKEALVEIRIMRMIREMRDIDKDWAEAIEGSQGPPSVRSPR